MLDRELETLVMQGGELTNGTLDQIDELTHSMKNIQTIIAMHETEHGNSGRPYYDDGRMYRNGYSGRGGRMR